MSVVTENKKLMKKEYEEILTFDLEKLYFYPMIGCCENIWVEWM